MLIKSSIGRNPETLLIARRKKSVRKRRIACVMQGLLKLHIICLIAAVGIAIRGLMGEVNENRDYADFNFGHYDVGGMLLSVAKFIVR